MESIPIKEEAILLVLIYFSIVLILTKVASNRKIGKMNTFVLSTVFTPVAGFFYVLLSGSPANTYRHKVKIHQCPHCKFEFKRSFHKCPVCGTEKR